MKPRSYSKEISGEKKEILSKVIEIREDHTKPGNFSSGMQKFVFSRLKQENFLKFKNLWNLKLV